MRFRRRHCVLLIALLGLSAACRGRTVAPTWYEHTDLATTMKRASAQERPLLLKFDAVWCSYCAQLDEQVFADAKVQDLAKQFFLIHVDGDRANADAIMEKYQVETYPTVIFAKTDGAPLGAWHDVPDAAAFAAQMQEILAEQKEHASWAPYLAGKLPMGKLVADAYLEEAAVLEEQGDYDGARVVYRRGGLELLAQINQAQRMDQVRSFISPAIQLLHQGGALGEAELLCQQAIHAFPDDFLYYYRYAHVLRDQGRIRDAVIQAEAAYGRAYGRNTLWVADTLSDLLMQTGNQPRAAQVIRETLAAIDWEKNQRRRAVRYKARLEARLKDLAKQP